MLAYLDALLDALAVRDAAEVQRLLGHPLARILPDMARAEAMALADGRADALSAPLRLMQLRHQVAELLRDAPPVADLAEPVPAPDPIEAADAPRAPRAHPTARTRRPGRMVQMELPLSA
jgi:hypothetical protein